MELGILKRTISERRLFVSVRGYKMKIPQVLDQGDIIVYSWL
jgi:hypothetical protein